MRADLGRDLSHDCKEHPIAVLVRLAALFELCAVFLIYAEALV